MDGADTQGQPADDDPLAEYDWLVTLVVPAVAVVVGLGMVVAGAGLAVAIDEALLAEVIAEESITFDPLTRAEMVTVFSTAAEWTAIGLAVTGGAIALGGVGFAVSRRGRPTSERRFLTNTVLGAVTTWLASFVPFSPVVGGLVAGYLQPGGKRAASKAGAASGALSAAPLALMTLFLFLGIGAGLLAIQAAGVALLIGAVLLFTVAVSIGFSAGLGALGGYIGARIRDSGSPAGTR